jgi:hypothetical protein
VLGIPLLTALLVLVVPFMAVGVLAVPALIQWPVPRSQQYRRARYLFTGPRVGGAW